MKIQKLFESHVKISNRSTLDSISIQHQFHFMDYNLIICSKISTFPLTLDKKLNKFIGILLAVTGGIINFLCM